MVPLGSSLSFAGLDHKHAQLMMQQKMPFPFKKHKEKGHVGMGTLFFVLTRIFVHKLYAKNAYFMKPNQLIVKCT